jgi:hypothetical protein
MDELSLAKASILQHTALFYPDSIEFVGSYLKEIKQSYLYHKSLDVILSIYV